MDVWTWEQAALIAECIEDRLAERADLVVMPMVALQGGKFKGYAHARKKEKAKERKKAAEAKLPPEIRNELKLAALAKLGLRVRTQRADGAAE